jgi:ABC-type siderophore export system fused ATPase/permease subunit
MNALIGFIALIVVAVIGWAIAEFKYKTFTFTRSAKDIEEEEELEEQKRAEGFKEMNIHDIMRKNSTNGYNAVG